MKTWFCINANGDIENLGKFSDSDDAFETEKALSAIWVFDDETAREWMQSIQSGLEEN